MKLVEYDKNNLTETRVEYKLVESGARGPAGLPPTNIVHNDTTSKQGGAAGEFYHSTANENAAQAGANSPGPLNVFATIVDAGIDFRNPFSIATSSASASWAAKSNQSIDFGYNGGEDLADFNITTGNLGDDDIFHVQIKEDENINPALVVRVPANDEVSLLNLKVGGSGVFRVVDKTIPLFEVLASSGTIEPTARKKTISGPHTLDESDADYLIYIDSDLTIPAGLPTDFVCAIRQTSGTTATVLTSGTTLSTFDSLFDLEQDKWCALTHDGADAWSGVGGFS